MVQLTGKSRLSQGSGVPRAASRLFVDLVRCFLPVILLLASSSLSFAHSGDSESNDTANEQLDATAMVNEVVHSEIESQLNDHSLWCFREQRQVDSKARKTLAVCSTKDGDLERVVAIDGRELSPTESRAEEQRVEKLINHPAQLRAKQKKQEEDDEQFRTLLKAVPQAFRFQYKGTEGDLVTLHFQPNPKYHPASRQESVFHHMEGTLVVDQKRKRLAEIVGLITSEVKFGGGLLGHLDKGGTFVVKAGEVAPGHWDTTLMNLDLSGKALFFKTIAIHQDEKYADYTRVPDNASLEQVAALLQKECNNIHIASNQ